MGSIRVSLTNLGAIARELKSTDGENAEYDRALVEFFNRASGLSDDMLPQSARTLGISSELFLAPNRGIAWPEPEPQVPPRLDDWQYEVANGDTRLGYAEWFANNPEAVPTEITLKFVLDLAPGDDVDAAVEEYIAENGLPEAIVEPLT